MILRELTLYHWSWWQEIGKDGKLLVVHFVQLFFTGLAFVTVNNGVFHRDRQVRVLVGTEMDFCMSGKNILFSLLML